MVKWARRDPRRLLGSDDVGGLFYRLLVLCNTSEQMAQGCGRAETACSEDHEAKALESSLALAVCGQVTATRCVAAIAYVIRVSAATCACLCQSSVCACV